MVNCFESPAFIVAPVPVIAKVAAAPGCTVIVPVEPDIVCTGSVAVIVAVSPALVSVNPPIFAMPLLNV